MNEVGGDLFQDALIWHAKKIMKEALFQAWKIGKAIDRTFGGLNYVGYDTFRQTECLRTHEQGILPSVSSVKRDLMKLNNHMDQFLKIEKSTYNSREIIGFYTESLVRFIIIKYGLHDIAIQDSIELALTMDGATLSDNMDHVTIGVKLADKRTIDPVSGAPLFSNDEGYQSTSCCFPIKSYIGSEVNIQGRVCIFRKACSRITSLQNSDSVCPLDGKAAIHIREQALRKMQTLP
jgi:hypothetical protein